MHFVVGKGEPGRDVTEAWNKRVALSLSAQRERTLRKVIQDDCEDEERVKNLVRPILGELKTDGDSYGAPSMSDIVESLLQRESKLALTARKGEMTPG